MTPAIGQVYGSDTLVAKALDPTVFDDRLPLILMPCAIGRRGLGSGSHTADNQDWD